MNNSLAVVSIGMISSLGADVETISAAVDAGINRFNDSPYFNKRGKNIRIAVVPDDALPPLDERLYKVKKISSSHAYMIQMAAYALSECVSDIAETSEIPLFVACPEILPNSPSRLKSNFFQHVQAQSNIPFDLNSSKIISTGRAGGFQAIGAAFKFMQESGKPFALVGGVDSFRFSLLQLSQLDAEDRLLVENGTGGFVPGDASGFLLLASDEVVKTQNLKRLLNVSVPVCVQEEGHMYSELAYRGDGLANAFQGALRAIPGFKADSIYSSLNGEAIWAKELGVAMLRSSSMLDESAEIRHPADCFGDIGAAFGPVLLGLMSTRNKCNSLAYCSSDGPQRSAICAWK